MPSTVDEFWKYVRKGTRPIRSAQLKHRAPKRHRMLRLSLAGKHVVRTTMFFRTVRRTARLAAQAS